jgi:hypothetical protein
MLAAQAQSVNGGVPTGAAYCDKVYGSAGRTGIVKERQTNPGSSAAKGDRAMIYGVPATTRFLEAVQRLKKARQRKEIQTRQAKMRVRSVLRKLRDC